MTVTPIHGDDEGLEQVTKLSREAKAQARLMGRDAARFLVDTYYRWQEHRIALRGQARAAAQGVDDADTLVHHFADQAEMLERQMVAVLDEWTDAQPEAVWAKSQYGIGPVIAAGLAAHIDVEKAATAGAVWRFAGLDPTVTWGKGEKRPWNADLKVLCWKIGGSFVKFSNRDDCFYGKLYRERKAYEVERNDSGGNAEAAARMLSEKNIRVKELRERLESGRLSDGQIDARARRWTVKLFLAHYWENAYRERFGVDPPLPYPIAHQGHAHRIDPPK